MIRMPDDLPRAMQTLREIDTQPLNSGQEIVEEEDFSQARKIGWRFIRLKKDPTQVGSCEIMA